MGGATKTADTSKHGGLPVSEVIAPDDAGGVADAVREAYGRREAVYPIGGGTSLDYGLAAREPGIGIATTGLAKVVDYPARDMTITVEAGITLAALGDTMRGEGQALPVDVPRANEATLGGAIVTNATGPRCYGCGTLRDYVIGIRAVDGRGMPFRGGGRVVKNVAGYDFCKLLTGSMGTLGLVTEVTLKAMPIPARRKLVWANVDSMARGERVLERLARSTTTPSAIEFVYGGAWDGGPLGDANDRSCGRVIAVVEGTDPEVEWMESTLRNEWREEGLPTVQAIEGEEGDAIWRRLVEFSHGDPCELALRIVVLPSGTANVVEAVRRLDGAASLQAHAGNGVVWVRFDEMPEGGLTGAAVKGLQQVAASNGGKALVVSCSDAGELTRQAVWGTPGGDLELMRSVKTAFDPAGILNPHRFVYGDR